jgi:hypothetical protein
MPTAEVRILIVECIRITTHLCIPTEGTPSISRQSWYVQRKNREKNRNKQRNVSINNQT